MQPLLHVRNLSISFSTDGELTRAVDDITFSVNRGELLGIAGESGSGKSVTSLAILRLLNTLPAEYISGEILFSEDGEKQTDIFKAGEEMLRAIRGRKIAMIFQEPMTSLNPVFTCGEQVTESIRLHQQLTSEQAKQKAMQLFEKVKLPHATDMLRRYPHQLSGGQKQRVMIAMAMSSDPALLICDEPTTALDVTVQKNVLSLIRELQNETHMGVIFISHDLGVIADIADKVLIMQKGKIVEQGMVEQIFSKPQHPYTKALLACRPALYRKGTRLPIVSDFISGSGTRSIPTKTREYAPGGVLMKVRGISVRYPAKKSLTGKALAYTTAVDDVSFDIYEGETLGLVGESGCGKTTLGRTLLRLVAPSMGSIAYQGKDLLSVSGKELRKFRKNMQIIFQDPYSSLNPSMRIGSAIDETLRIHYPELTSAARRKRVEELLSKVQLEPAHANRYPHEFSGGQRQRVVIARALAVSPKFIVCDESVSALDVSIQAQILNLLNELKLEFGFTCVFISHDLAVVRYISDRIMVMEKGRIVETGSAEELYNRPKTPYTRKLLESLPGAALQG